MYVYLDKRYWFSISETDITNICHCGNNYTESHIFGKIYKEKIIFFNRNDTSCCLNNK